MGGSAGPVVSIAVPSSIGNTGAPSFPESSSAAATPTPITVPFSSAAAGVATGKRIGLVAATSGDVFTRAVGDSIIAELTVAGAELVRCDPDVDGSLLPNCVQRMKSQALAGWILVPPIADTDQNLCPEGPPDIPLIGVQSALTSCDRAVVGIDDRESGHLAGAALATAARDKFRCVPSGVIFLTDAHARGAADRLAGLRSGYTSVCPGTIPGETVLDVGNREQAYTAFTSAVAGRPRDATLLVAAVDDDIALGALAAIPDSRTASILMVGIGADRRARCTVRTDPRWLGDTALFPDRYGGVVVPALLDSIAGKTIPRVLRVTPSFLDAHTVDRFYPESECSTS